MNVLWRDPCHPVEVTQRLKDVIGEPEVDEHATKAVQEIAQLADLPSIGSGVVFVVESTIQRDCGQIRRPDRSGGVDQETTGQTSQTVTNEVSGEGNQDYLDWSTRGFMKLLQKRTLITEAGGPRLVEEPGDVLDPDNISAAIYVQRNSKSSERTTNV